ncbi:MAG: hypothetical protein ACOX3V_01470 [Bacillota bacterium]
MPTSGYNVITQAVRMPTNPRGARELKSHASKRGPVTKFMILLKWITLTALI